MLLPSWHTLSDEQRKEREQFEEKEREKIKIEAKKRKLMERKVGGKILT